MGGAIRVTGVSVRELCTGRVNQGDCLGAAAGSGWRGRMSHGVVKEWEESMRVWQKEKSKESNY